MGVPVFLPVVIGASLMVLMLIFSAYVFWRYNKQCKELMAKNGDGVMGWPFSFYYGAGRAYGAGAYGTGRRGRYARRHAMMTGYHPMDEPYSGQDYPLQAGGPVYHQGWLSVPLIGAAGPRDLHHERHRSTSPVPPAHANRAAGEWGVSPTPAGFYGPELDLERGHPVPGMSGGTSGEMSGGMDSGGSSGGMSGGTSGGVVLSGQ